MKLTYQWKDSSRRYWEIFLKPTTYTLDWEWDYEIFCDSDRVWSGTVSGMSDVMPQVSHIMLDYLSNIASASMSCERATRVES